jgi:hypothetical protein
VRAFKDVGIPVGGEEHASMKTVTGVLNNYGWEAGYLLVIVVSIAETVLTMVIVSPANRVMGFFSLIGFIPLNSMLLLGAVTWWRRRRRNDTS